MATKRLTPYRRRMHNIYTSAAASWRVGNLCLSTRGEVTRVAGIDALVLRLENGESLHISNMRKLDPRPCARCNQTHVSDSERAACSRREDL